MAGGAIVPTSLLGTSLLGTTALLGTGAPPLPLRVIVAPVTGSTLRDAILSRDEPRVEHLISLACFAPSAADVSFAEAMGSSPAMLALLRGAAEPPSRAPLLGGGAPHHAAPQLSLPPPRLAQQPTIGSDVLLAAADGEGPPHLPRSDDASAPLSTALSTSPPVGSGRYGYIATAQQPQLH